MIFQALDRIRRHPRAVRERYAFFLAAGFVGVVAILWSFSLPGRFSNILSATDGEIIESSTVPFSSFWGEMQNQLDSLSEEGEIDSAQLPTDDSAAAASSSAEQAAPLVISEETLEQFRSASTTAAGTAPAPAPPRTVQIATTSAAREAADE